jgi:hypothetical protein
LIGGSCVVDPDGRIVAEASSLADELVLADCDLDMCRQGKDKMFKFAAHRRPEHYGAITGQVGVIEPARHESLLLRVENRHHQPRAGVSRGAGRDGL